MSMFIRINIPLMPAENEALKDLARSERRRAEAQAAWIIRAELERLGLLATDEPKTIEKQAAGVDSK